MPTDQSWPFKKVMTKDHLHALKKAYPHPRINKTNEGACKGYYQNFGLQSTCRASGSLVTPPNQTSKHHHYHEGFNKSAISLFTKVCNHLCDEAKQAIIHLGQPFLHTTMKLREVTEFFDVFNGSLITYGGYMNLIHHDRRDQYPSSESKRIKSLVSSQPDTCYDNYIKQYEKT